MLLFKFTVMASTLLAIFVKNKQNPPQDSMQKPKKAYIANEQRPIEYMDALQL